MHLRGLAGARARGQLNFACVSGQSGRAYAQPGASRQIDRRPGSRPRGEARPDWARAYLTAATRERTARRRYVRAHAPSRVPLPHGPSSPGKFTCRSRPTTRIPYRLRDTPRFRAACGLAHMSASSGGDGSRRRGWFGSPVHGTGRPHLHGDAVSSVRGTVYRSLRSIAIFLRPFDGRTGRRRPSLQKADEHESGVMSVIFFPFPGEPSRRPAEPLPVAEWGVIIIVVAGRPRFGNA
jgi:hypothetical protein